MLCSPAQQRYTALLENISLYFVLYFVFELISLPSMVIHASQLCGRLSFFFPLPMPYSIPSFLNVTVLYYNVFTKAVYNQNSKCLL
jgi:hypothetical protein